MLPVYLSNLPNTVPGAAYIGRYAIRLRSWRLTILTDKPNWGLAELHVYLYFQH